MDKKQQLDLFLQRADELNNSRLLRTGFGLKLEIKYEEGKGLTTEHTEPDKDDLKAFLLDFRHFVSNDEPVQMHKIYNLLYLTLTDAELKEALVQSREMFKTARKFAGMQLEIDGKTYEPEEILSIWINGSYFHDDPAKKKQLEELTTKGLNLGRHNMLEFIIEATKQIQNVRMIALEAIARKALNFV